MLTAAGDGSGRTSARSASRDVLTLSAAIAVLVGVIHVVVVEVQLHVFHLLTWTSREFVWMAPLGYLICFIAVALPIIAMHVVLPRLMTFRIAAVLLLALGALSLLFLYQRIEPTAQVLLALGLGIQGARLVDGRREYVMARARRIVVWGGTGVAAAGLLAAGGREVSERLAMSRRTPVDAGLPNVLLIIFDTVRASSMGLYGSLRPTTPVLEQLARESTVFDAAFPTAPWSLPSHASLLTGLWPTQAKGDYFRPIDGNVKTLAERMRDRGYATGGFAANTGYVGHETGLQRGFLHFEDYPVNGQQLMLSPTLTRTKSGLNIVDAVLKRQKWYLRAAFEEPGLRVAVTSPDPLSAGEIARRFLSWRDGLDHGPYFAMLNFMDAHDPDKGPTEFRTRFDRGKEKLDQYEGAIAYMDSVVGTIVDSLKRRGELDRTILIVTSDHGDAFGEHGVQGHGKPMFLPVVHVPLLVRMPGRAPAGVRVAQVVSLRDIPATVVDLTRDPSPTVPGVSLARAWETPPRPTSPVLLENAHYTRHGQNLGGAGRAMKGWIDSTWHYIRFGDGSEMIFAWKSDPGELNDRAGSPEGRAAICRSRRQISNVLGVRFPPPPADSGC
jgi:arylsulfatase A-like enzyme